MKLALSVLVVLAGGVRRRYRSRSGSSITRGSSRCARRRRTSRRARPRSSTCSSRPRARRPRRRRPITVIVVSPTSLADALVGDDRDRTERGPARRRAHRARARRRARRCRCSSASRTDGARRDQDRLSSATAADNPALTNVTIGGAPAPAAGEMITVPPDTDVHSPSTPTTPTMIVDVADLVRHDARLRSARLVHPRVARRSADRRARTRAARRTRRRVVVGVADQRFSVSSPTVIAASGRLRQRSCTG